MHNDASAMKVGTDGVLLGAAMTLSKNDCRLLDAGTGTGVVALLAAQRLCDAGADFHIEALDIDAAAAGEAALNFSESPWASRLQAQNLPLQLFKPEGKFDCIFSNPPYYDNSLENPDSRKTAARHTDSLSWRELCAFAADFLSPSGRLQMILPADCRASLLRTAASFGLFPFRIIEIHTSSRKPSKRIIAEFSRSKRECALESIDLQQPNCTSMFYL